jgi:hypothetical protein
MASSMTHALLYDAGLYQETNQFIKDQTAAAQGFSAKAATSAKQVMKLLDTQYTDNTRQHVEETVQKAESSLAQVGSNMQDTLKQLLVGNKR